MTPNKRTFEKLKIETGGTKNNTFLVLSFPRSEQKGKTTWRNPYLQKKEQRKNKRNTRNLLEPRWMRTLFGLRFSKSPTGVSVRRLVRYETLSCLYVCLFVVVVLLYFCAREPYTQTRTHAQHTKNPFTVSVEPNITV